MNDKELARKSLTQGVNLAVVKDGEILLVSDLPGIRGILGAIDELGAKVEGSSVADTIVGKAVALLLAYSRAAYVFARTISDAGSHVLEENGIEYDCEGKVTVILNREKTGPCPFEELTARISSPQEAFHELTRHR